VFYRFRKFFEGFADGVVAGIDRIKNAFAKIGGFISDTFGGIFGEGTFFNDLLKKFTPESSVDDWEAWGKTIGEIATGLFAIILAIKGISLASTLLGALTNPLGTILVLVTALVAYWDKWQQMVESFWGSFGGLAPENKNTYEQQKQRYINEGWEFNTNDDVIAIPKNMQRDPLLKSVTIPGIQEELKKLRSGSYISANEEAERRIQDFNEQQKIQSMLPPSKYDFLKQQNQSAPLIIQHHENQAGMNSEAANAAWPEALRNLTVDNKIQVQVAGMPFTIELNGEPIWQQIVQLQENHTIRQGGGDN